MEKATLIACLGPSNIARALPGADLEVVGECPLQAPGMVSRQHGSIVNLGTMAATVGMAGLSTHGATKAALESLTRTWAVELGGSGVRVKTVAPGPTRTDTVMTNMGEEGAAQVAATS